MSADRMDPLSGKLAALKRRGSNLLVVSGPDGGDRVCRHLLGDPAEKRRALFVPTTVGVSDVRSRWPGPEVPDRFGVVDVTGTRSRDAIGGTGLGPEGVAAQVDDVDWYHPVEDTENLAAIGDAIRDGLNRLGHDDPDPGTVRFCLDSLDPLLDAASPETVFRFLHVVTATVRHVSGMGHVHIAESVPTTDRSLFDPLFDATVIVEAGPDGVRERWRLHESGYETGWLAV